MPPIQDREYNLDARRRAILQALVEEHVDTSRPVSSTSVVRRSNIGVSSATVRNEFAVLEELQLIEKPHTSAGRVPSDRGYRVYVDEVLPVKQTDVVPRSLEERLQGHDSSLRELLSRACRALSDLTGYTAMVMIPTLTRDTMRHLQLGSVDSESLLVLFVTVSGRTEHSIYRLEDHHLTRSRLEKLNRLLSEKLCGLPLSEIRALKADELLAEFPGDAEARQIVDLVIETIPEQDDQEVLVEGVVCLLAEPEFRTAERARPVVEALEAPGVVARLLAGLAAQEGAHVVIGREHVVESVRPCSVVGASYEAPGALTGGVGVLGPRRMRYAETLPVVEHLAEGLSRAIAHG